MKRREVIRNVALGLGSMAIGSKYVEAAGKINACSLTPAQVKGPFYPMSEPLETDADLTRIVGSNQRAVGEIVIIRGVLTDQFCKPVKGAIVEVWQACHTGRYDHPSDPSTAELDPNFQYFARMITNAQGEYRFKTIIPGAYHVTERWLRPPHIHFRVVLRGYKELITQMYFAGNSLNERDQILMSLPLPERKKLIVDFNQMPSNPKIKVGDFPLSVEKI